ncbi:MAG: recombinase family protein [Faecousia sp.]
MKRVLCLYRVSTKGQVDPKDDIPMQRRECLDFIAKQDDWSFFDERLEKGVSGFKVSAAKRDVIIEIREMAERKMFDVLLVFMFDRLGRREDETPFLVQWFVERGIEVWSTREGQQKLDNRVDKLMNFIRFWQAGGESEKTAMRVKAAHTQMTADGIWRGGAKPYGYQLVHNGRIGKKNRPLYDLVIDEIEGPIVKEIFDLISVDGMGILRIANSLNEKYAHLGKVWTAASVRTILHNIVYTGRLHMNETLSDPIEALRIIPDSQFEFVQYALKARIPRKYEQQRKAENDAIPREAKSKASVYGATMLSGILYCAHCGKKLVGSYCTKQRANKGF